MGALAKKKILVIDDYPAILESIKHVLDLSGYDVKTDVSGRNLATLKEDLPDLILLDFWLPGVSGYDLYRLLKTQVQTQNIPIILMSADNVMLRKISTLEPYDILVKPFDINELLEKINYYLT
jgi:DNA-binding response OmpR family regulator